MSSLSSYLAELDQLYRTGQTSEYSYLPALAATGNLMRQMDAFMGAT